MDARRSHPAVRRGRAPALVLVLVVAFSALAAVAATGQDGGPVAARCDRFAEASILRLRHDFGPTTPGTPRVVVIGDSYSVGLGLVDPYRSWPSRLPGRVRVSGFSGSGLGAAASPCGVGASFGRRAPTALRDGADVLVVQVGLNDWDSDPVALRRGFGEVMAAAADVGHVVVVGPPAAPQRARRMPPVEAALRRLSAEAGADYVTTSDLTLDYLPDGLHLTPAGHVEFGDAVAARVEVAASASTDT